jgi:phage shock protein E
MQTVFSRLVGLLIGILLSAAALAELPEEAVWIDTRTPAEFAEGHLPGANLIPFDAIETQILALDVDKDTPLYLYCARGQRAEAARQALLRQGYTRVTNVGGLADALKLTGQEAVR